MSSTERAARHDSPPLPRVHRIARCERSVRAVKFPETQVSDSVNCIKRPVDQIHNILVWRAVQRESLNTRQGSKAGKIRVRTGREKMRPPPLRAKEKNIISLIILISSCHNVQCKKYIMFYGKCSRFGST